MGSLIAEAPSLTTVRTDRVYGGSAVKDRCAAVVIADVRPNND